MALRLIQSTSNSGKTMKVYRDTEWGEYRTRLYFNGVLQPKSDYHTDDKDDAIETGLLMIGMPSVH